VRGVKECVRVVGKVWEIGRAAVSNPGLCADACTHGGARGRGERKKNKRSPKRLQNAFGVNSATKM
jgi:hypothetical protein